MSYMIFAAEDRIFAALDITSFEQARALVSCFNNAYTKTEAAGYFVQYEHNLMFMASSDEYEALAEKGIASSEDAADFITDAEYSIAASLLVDETGVTAYVYDTGYANVEEFHFPCEDIEQAYYHLMWDECRKLIVDGTYGINVPKRFAANYAEQWNLSVEDTNDLLAGPGNPHYTEVWEEVLKNAVYIDEDGIEYRLHHDNDLFSVPVGAEEYEC